MLPIFNLSKILANHQKKLSPDETFGCPYLDKTLLSSSQQIISAINDASDLFIFSKSECSFLAQRHSKLKTWRTNIQNNTDSIKKIWDDFKKIPALPATMINKETLLNWRKQHYVMFANTENWINLTPQRMALEKFHQLKTAWKKQSPFALPNIETITAIATELLPSLIEHYQHALKNLWRYYLSIPTHIYTAYKKYLKDFLTTAKQVQQQIAETMYARLKAFSDTGLVHADAIVHLAEQLKIKHPPAIDKPNTKQFLQFHQYIQQHGDIPLKQKLSVLTWFQSDSPWALEMVTKKKSSTIVPQILAKDTPSKPKKPAWLFKGANLRYELCNNHALDFVSLQQLPDTNQLQANLNSIEATTTTLNDLQKKQKLIANLLDEIQQPAYSKLSTRHWRTHKFLENYRQLLQDHRQKIISIQLLVAEKLASHINTTDRDHKISSALEMSFQLGNTLHTILQNLQTTITSCNNPTLKNQLRNLQSQYHECLALHRAAELLKKTKQGYLLEEADLSYIKTVLSGFELTTHPSWQEFTHQIARANLHNLIKELKRNPNDIGNSLEQNTHLKNIHQRITILKLLVPQHDINSIKKLFLKYFLYYLNTILNCNTDTTLFNKNASLLNMFENVITSIPKIQDIFIGNTTLAEYLENFKKLRSQKNWIDIHAEAESLAHILAEKRLVKRIDKACTQLNAETKVLFAKNEPLYSKQTRYLEGKNISDSDLVSTLALNVSARLTTHGKQTLDNEITKKLKPHEQVLLGITQTKSEKENIAFIPTLIEINSQAQQLQQIAHNETLSYPEKLQAAFTHQKNFNRTVKTLKQLYRAIPTEFGQSKKSNPLFFKSYISLATEPASNLLLKPTLVLNS